MIMPPYLEISRVSINILINIWASVAGSVGSQVKLFLDSRQPGGREDISDLGCGVGRAESWEAGLLVIPIIKDQTPAHHYTKY